MDMLASSPILQKKIQERVVRKALRRKNVKYICSNKTSNKSWIKKITKTFPSKLSTYATQRWPQNANTISDSAMLIPTTIDH